MSSRHVSLTYRDYAALPDDGRRYEIHDGELSVTPAPSPQHQRCSANLFRLLDGHVRANGLGEVLYAPLDVVLSDTAIVQPDLVYLAPDSRGIVTSRGIEGPPTLVVEILSPSTASTDRGTKLHLYAHHGVPFCWLVDTEARVIEAYRLVDATYALVLRGSAGVLTDFPPFRGLALIPESIWP